MKATLRPDPAIEGLDVTAYEIPTDGPDGEESDKDELGKMLPHDRDAVRFNALLPAVREADPEDLIVADGFSCKTQIETGSNRRALHLAQVMKFAREWGAEGTPGLYPERACQGKRPLPSRSETLRRNLGVLSLALVTLGAGAYAAGRLLGWR